MVELFPEVFSAVVPTENWLTWAGWGVFVCVLVLLWLLVRFYRRREAEHQRLIRALKREGSECFNGAFRYRDFFQIASDGILVAEAAGGKIVDANPRAQEMVGKGLDELRGSLLADLFSGEQRTHAERFFQRLQDSSETQTISLELKLPPNKCMAVEMRARSFVLDGRPHLLALLRDVTLLQEAERRLKLRDELLSATAISVHELITVKEEGNALQDALFRLGRASRCVRVCLVENCSEPGSPVQRELVAEWKTDSLPNSGKQVPFFPDWEKLLEAGQPVWGWSSELPPEWEKIYRERGAASYLILPIMVGSQWWGYLELDHPQEQREWEPFEFDILTLSASTLGGLISQFRLQAQTLEAQRRYNFAVQAAQAGVWDYNFKTGAFHVAPAFLQFLGFPRQKECKSLAQWLTCLVEEDRPLLQQALAECLKERAQNFEFTVCIRNPLGERRWVILRGELFHDSSGLYPRLVGIMSDITEIKKIQVELLEAKEKAEAANRAKSDFLAMISHEIRTPLNAVIGFTDLLSSTDLNEEQREFCRDIVGGGNALLAVINDILDYTRLDSATTTKLDMAPCNLLAEIEHVYRMFRDKALEKNLSLSLELSPQLPGSILTDAGRFRQVLTNLVSNAIKFTDRGSIRIAAEAKWHSAEKSWEIVVQVVDTGCGIPEEMQERIFEPFFQVDTSITRSHGGVGLGLSISRRLVQLMGGRISVSSRPQEGSTFTFTIRAGVPEVKESVSVPVAKESRPESVEPLKIVYAEDNQANIAVMRALLRSQGYAVDAVGEGYALLDYLRRQPADVVLMDVQMPGMDGLEATRRLRRGECGEAMKRVFIVGVTASALAGDREKCLQAGMNSYLAKPIKRADLAAVIKQALAWRKGGNAA